MRHCHSSLKAFVVALLLAVATVAPSVARQVEIHGLDPANLDQTVDPTVDFYRYANGGWLDRTTIPPDEGAYGTFTELEDRTRQQLLDLLGGLAGSDALEPGTDAEKALRLFEQGTDLAARDAAGIAPIQPTLDEIAALDDLEAFHEFLKTSQFSGIWGLFGLYAYPDWEDSSMMAADLGGPYFGLPNRDYYLEDDEGNAEIRAAYVDTSAKLLEFLGLDEARAETTAQAVYDFERQLVEPTLTREEWQDASLIYNPTTIAELSAQYPMMDWPGYLDALGVENVEIVLVDEARYMKALDEIVRQTPLPVLKDYLTLELLWSYSDLLTEDIADTAFAFQGRVLSGVAEQRPVEERVVESVNGVMGEAVSQLYVAEYFPPEAKAQITELVEELRAAFRERLETNTWMTPATRERALEKLDRLGLKVSYPDQWRSYEQVEIGSSYAESSRNAFNVETRRTLDQIGKPVDRNEWFIPPQTVNAFYNVENNEIVFPAAFLQPPYFDYQADAASNFGAIGAVIGHEITHGFDLQGAQFDADGNLNDWWTPEDYERFQELNDEVVAQYAAIEMQPGLFIDGQITVPENVADMGGVQVAYDALLRHLAAENQSPSTPAAAASGADLDLTPEQRFFVAWATAWREQTRDEYLTTLIKTDPHSPAAIRGTLPIRNMDAFFTAFDITPADPMYLPPEERIVIW